MTSGTLYDQRMGAIAIRCPECGATIPAPESSTVATCAYCGTKSQIRRRTRFLEIPQPAAQLPGPALPMAMQQHSKRWMVGLIMMPVFIGGAIALTLFAQRAASRAAEGPAHLRESGWDGTSGAALVDVDGDGTIDIVGRAEVIQPEHIAMIGAWHGTTGKRLWVTAALGPRNERLQAPIAVVGQVVMTTDARAGISAFKLGDGTPLWSIRLNEKINRFCVGAEGMVLAQTADEQMHPIKVADGALQPAGPAAGPCIPVLGDNHRGDRDAWDVWSSHTTRALTPGTKIEGLDSTTALHHRGTGRLLALGHKTPGTRVPMIAAYRWPEIEAVDIAAIERQVSATKDPKERNRLREIARTAEAALRNQKPEAQWTAQVPGIDPLSVSEGDPDPEDVAFDADAVIVAYGTRTTHVFRLSSIAMSDGRRRWDIELPGNDPMTTVLLSPTHALVSRWSGLYAFDRATGAPAFVIR
jgi:hypothetical protein